MKLPALESATAIAQQSRVLYMAAYGFERRGEQWLKMQPAGRLSHCRAILFKYHPEKIESRKVQLQKELVRAGISKAKDIVADIAQVARLEVAIEQSLEKYIHEYDEVIVDVTSMSKLLILLCVAKLRLYPVKVKIIYTELADYEPARAQFDAAMKKGINISAPFPSRGIESVVRAPALSSIRMQGQPVTLIAFTSFNEQLVRHVVGSISPHRLVLIGGIPPRLAWREMATQKIHESVINEYRVDNPIGADGKLANRVSTLHYQETYHLLLRLYREWGSYERIMAAATGSKMQTLALGLIKQVLPDIHIEYPTPKSYYIGQNNSSEVAAVHEINFEKFRDTIDELRKMFLDFEPNSCLIA